MQYNAYTKKTNTCATSPHASTSIRIFAMRHTNHGHAYNHICNFVNDSVITRANTKAMICANKFLASSWPGFRRKALNYSDYFLSIMLSAHALQFFAR